MDDVAKKKKATTRKKASKRSPRKTKAKRKPVLLGSQRAIAKHFKRSVATIHEWTKRSDWVFEKPSDRNRILASEIKKWMDRTFTKTKEDVLPGTTAPPHSEPEPGRGSGRTISLQDARTAKTVIETKKAKLELEMLMGMLIRRDEAHAEIQGIVAQTRSAFIEYARTRCELLVSMGLITEKIRHKIEPEIQEGIETILHNMANKLNDVPENCTAQAN